MATYTNVTVLDIRAFTGSFQDKNGKTISLKDLVRPAMVVMDETAINALALTTKNHTVWKALDAGSPREQVFRPQTQITLRPQALNVMQAQPKTHASELPGAGTVFGVTPEELLFNKNGNTGNTVA